MESCDCRYCFVLLLVSSGFAQRNIINEPSVSSQDSLRLKVSCQHVKIRHALLDGLRDKPSEDRCGYLGDKLNMCLSRSNFSLSFLC